MAKTSKSKTTQAKEPVAKSVAAEVAQASPRDVSSRLLNLAQIEIKFGSYGVCGASSVLDPSILPRVQEYKRQTASRMIPLDRETMLKRILPADYLASRKVDGEFTVLVYRDGEIFSINPGGTVRVGLPVLQEAAAQLQAAKVSQAMVCGELAVVHPDGHRERVHDVIQFTRSPESQAELEQLHFRPFDLLELDGKPPSSYSATWPILERIFTGGQRCRVVETVPCKTPADIGKLFAQWVEGEGAEGIVLRSETAGNYKIKPRHSIDAVVIGFTESTADRIGLMHDLLLALMRGDGSLQVLCRVGGGFTDDQRREMLADLKDHIVSSEYAEVNSDHVAYQMVEPRWVVEINCLDLVSQSTRGAPIQRMALDWSASDRIYRVVRRMPLVSVISPQFVRLREDKRITSQDVRIDQVSKIVDVPMIDRDARQMKLPPSQLIAREVYTKQLKGETMVRKFVMWQTHKSQLSDEYPEYVVHFTDYSPNRATPLAREVRVSNSLEQMQSLWDALKSENIKKGWEKVEV